MSRPRPPVTLVAGGDVLAREAVAQAWCIRQGAIPLALMLEGLPSAQPWTEASCSWHIQRVFSLCPCCAGQAVLRTYLHRMLRIQPHALFLALSRPDHAESLAALLDQPAYATLIGQVHFLRLPDSSS